MSTKHKPLRPHMDRDSNDRDKREELKLDAAISVVEVMSSIRQSGIISGSSDNLTPKEIAAYNAALHRLECYLDER